MKNYKIAPSILSADFSRLGEDVEKVIDAGADMIHFDVMDNHYVPNLTFGPMVCASLREYGITSTIDVHLMVKPVDRTINLIKENGCKPGVVLNPATSIGCLEHCINDLDMILLMSVNPGFPGQKFINGTLKKISLVKDLINKSGKDIRLEVDGGINLENIGKAAEAGADTFVAGSAIFNSKSYSETITSMREVLSKIK